MISSRTSLAAHTAEDLIAALRERTDDVVSSLEPESAEHVVSVSLSAILGKCREFSKQLTGNTATDSEIRELLVRNRLLAPMLLAMGVVSYDLHVSGSMRVCFSNLASAGAALAVLSDFAAEDYKQIAFKPNESGNEFNASELTEIAIDVATHTLFSDMLDTALRAASQPAAQTLQAVQAATVISRKRETLTARDAVSVDTKIALTPATDDSAETQVSTVKHTQPYSRRSARQPASQPAKPKYSRRKRVQAADQSTTTQQYNDAQAKPNSREDTTAEAFGEGTQLSLFDTFEDVLAMSQTRAAPPTQSVRSGTSASQTSQVKAKPETQSAGAATSEPVKTQLDKQQTRRHRLQETTHRSSSIGNLLS